MALFMDEAGELIEWGEKKGKESIEEMENASTTDGPGQGKSREIVIVLAGDYERSLWTWNRQLR